jgi:hypothetical protein
VVLEHPEVPVEPDVDAGWLDELGLVRLKLHPAGLDFLPDVPVGEQHPGNLPVPVRCRGRLGPTTSVGRSSRRGCSSMVERQLPKLIVRVRFPSPAPEAPAQLRG